MKILLTVLIFIFNLQSLSYADDISSFEIEGFAIGDNILEHFTKQKLTQFSRSYGNDHNGIEIYSDVSKSHKRYYDLDKYDGLQISYTKNSDNYYEIISISGQIWFTDKINECLIKRDEVIEQIESILGSSVIKKNIKHTGRKHYADETGKSYTYDATFYLSNDNELRVDCYDWSKSAGYWDHLRIGVLTSEFMNLVDRDYNK